MPDSLDERLKALDEAKKIIIHDSFIAKQKQLDDQIEESTEQLIEHVNEEGSE